jgi:carboxypeptidase family protein/uncharacterized protein DUF4214
LYDELPAKTYIYWRTQMTEPNAKVRVFALLLDCFSNRKKRAGNAASRKDKRVKRLVWTVGFLLVAAGLSFGVLRTMGARTRRPDKTRPETSREKMLGAKAATQGFAGGRTYTPTIQPVHVFAPINFAEAAKQEALAPTEATPSEIKAIDPPKERPDFGYRGVAIPPGLGDVQPQNPTPSASGVSPAPSQTFSAEFTSGTSIPPDTMGAVGTTHIVVPTNNMMRITDRNGVQISRITTSSFWAGVTIKGTVASAFDPKIYFDRFNSRYIFFCSANGQAYNSGILIGISQTADPTGTWNRYEIDADPATVAGATGGKWADYPSIGFNKNWIVAMYNFFNWGSAGSGYNSPVIYVIDKANAYTNPVSLTVSTFTDPTTNCVSPFVGILGCGFTMAPAITEDNATGTEYLVEDWDNIAGQLRLSNLTGTGPAPVLTVGTQFPQSANSWMFNAARIAASGAGTSGASGGYVPQHQQSAHLVSGTRLMTNDSRIQNAVFRNGSLWCTHTVMLAATPTAAGSGFGTGNPDQHSGIQWWQIDPTLTDTGTGTVPTQRARIEDPLADNCNNGAGLNRPAAPCSNSTANQVGEFFAFPNISVNKNNDVLIGFTQFSALSFPSAAYAFRSHTDAANTFRDLIVYHAGESNLNVGGGSGTARQNRWGDTSESQTDPLNDTDFWTVQEYTGIYRDYGIGVAGPWETWWALVKPSTPAPATSGSLIISEFRLRGPQGVRDEFVELYNPSNSPLRVTTTDNSDGWALVYSSDGNAKTGVAVIPNGTFIPARGHILIADDPDSAAGTPAVVYSLSAYPNTAVRTSESDIGWAFDLADNGGLAVFNTSIPANWTAPNRLDSAGFNGIAAGLFKEGTGITNISATTPTGQMTFYRKLNSGFPQDTGDNASDFVFADPVAEVLTVTPRLGAAGPENLDSPIHNTLAGLTQTGIDPAVATAASPNFVFDPTVVPNGANGTIKLRRTFSNNTGSSISRLRLRVVDLTTLNSPILFGTQADLRLLTSTGESVAIGGSNPACNGGAGGGPCTMQPLTIETPPTQAIGGGFDSSVGANTVTLAAPLANGSAINLNLVFGIQTVGCYQLIIIAEALPGGASTIWGVNGSAGPNGSCPGNAPTAANGNIGGIITDSTGAPVSGVTINLSGTQSREAITDASGKYSFDGVETNGFYSVAPSRANYTFTPQNRSFSLLGVHTEASFTATANNSHLNPLDTNEFFVRQHYLDFLGREPDGPGFAGWVNTLNNCAGGDTSCDRVHVSEAFYRSQEFQERGYFAYRFYSTSFGRKPDYAEFVPDLARVSGFLTGDQLDAAKTAFIDDFMTRPAFARQYDSLSDTAFVDKLLQTSGVDLSSSRQGLIDALSTRRLSRAAVLRQIAESSEVYQKYYNQAFVVMEYFGYLHRDPDALYTDWIRALDANPADSRRMVDGFVNSAEYRNRFVP